MRDDYTEEEKTLLELAASVAVRGYSRVHGKSGKVSNVSGYNRGVRGSSLQVGDQVNTTFGGQKTVQNVANGRVYFSDGTSGLANAVYTVLGGPNSTPDDIYSLLNRLKKLPPVKSDPQDPLNTKAENPFMAKESPSGAILPTDQKGQTNGRRI